MDYLHRTNEDLALLLMYAGTVGNVDPELAKEAAVRLDPDVKKETPEARDKRYRELLRRGSKIEAIKAYRKETGCALRDAKDYIDKLEESIEPTLEAKIQAGPRGSIEYLSEGPVPEFVHCDTCNATIEYLPQDVEVRLEGQDWPDDWGDPSRERVRCPRVGCAGYGYIHG
jgi:hypothetical protein